MRDRIKRKVGRVLGSIRRKSFNAEKSWQLRQLDKQLRESQDVLAVHQMSKVGSRTIVASLKLSAPEYLILHTHFISEDGIAWLEGFVRQRWGKVNVPRHLWHSFFARQLYSGGGTKRNLKVITLVRDPVAREISEFFEEMDTHFNYPYSDRLRKTGLDGVVAELQERLLHRMRSDIDWTAPFNWLDREIKDVFGIDLLSDSFDTEAGYKIYRGANADILLLKLERLADCTDRAFQEFIGLDRFRLDRGRNHASGKYYADAYHALLDTFSVPEDILDACYASDHVRHFYSPSEIAGFAARWRASALANGESLKDRGHCSQERIAVPERYRAS